MADDKLVPHIRDSDPGLDTPCAKRARLEDGSSRSTAVAVATADAAAEEDDQGEDDQADDDQWAAEDQEKHKRLMAAMPLAKMLVALGKRPKVATRTSAAAAAAAVPLDNYNLASAVRLLLGDLHHALGVPFLPPELCRIVSDYASTDSQGEKTQFYYLVEADVRGKCDDDRAVCEAEARLLGRARSEGDMFQWCLHQMARAVEPSIDTESYEWYNLHMDPLYDRYNGVPIKVLVAGTMRWLRRSPHGYPGPLALVASTEPIWPVARMGRSRCT